MTVPIVVADTSVLINFLKIDRMDLLGGYPGRFLATDHVESELASDYPEQRARYQAALAANLLDTCSVTDPAEVALFLRLGPGVRLGAGECSAIAVAISRGYAIAIDDGRAIKVALQEAERTGVRLSVLRTREIMVGLIRSSVLTVCGRPSAENSSHQQEPMPPAFSLRRDHVAFLSERTNTTEFREVFPRFGLSGGVIEAISKVYRDEASELPLEKTAYSHRCSRGIDQLLHFGDFRRRKSTDLRMLSDDRLVLGEVHAECLVIRYVTFDPLNVRTELAQNVV